MLQASQNWRFTSWFIAIVALIAWVAVLLFAGILTPKDLLPAIKYLGVATISGFLAAIALNKYLWRFPCIRSLFAIPDLSGRWEGWRFSTLEQEWKPTSQEVTQCALDIAVEAWGLRNWARGISASIITDRLGGAVEFVWSYKAEVLNPPHGTGDVHAGTQHLRLSERGGKKYLEGRYINDRLRHDHTEGSVGYIRLVWVAPSLKGALSFSDEASWGMPKPQNEPTHDTT